MDLIVPTPPTSTPATPAASAASTPTGTTAEDRSTAFRAVTGDHEMQSGEKLLVEAYAAIWVILFALVLFSWRRQSRIDGRMGSLEAAIEKARRSSSTSRGGD
jgi:CcmD family protein